MPVKGRYLQIPGIRTWTSVGKIIQPITIDFDKLKMYIITPKATIKIIISYIVNNILQVSEAVYFSLSFCSLD